MICPTCDLDGPCTARSCEVKPHQCECGTPFGSRAAADACLRECDGQRDPHVD